MRYLFRAFEALAPRRDVYKRIENDTDNIIRLITDSIKSGNNRAIDIFNHVKKYRGKSIEYKYLNEILNSKLDDLWIVDNSHGRTKYYTLL